MFCSLDANNASTIICGHRRIYQSPLQKSPCPKIPTMADYQKTHLQPQVTSQQAKSNRSLRRGIEPRPPASC
jgi:hypothetical protein